jgi:hypothetical protein
VRDLPGLAHSGAAVARELRNFTEICQILYKKTLRFVRLRTILVAGVCLSSRELPAKQIIKEKIGLAFSRDLCYGILISRAGDRN